MATYNDNNVPFGTQVLNIGTTAYVGENINFTEPTNIVERRDQVGGPSGQVAIEGFGAGSAQLQLATTLTVVPAIGATFTLTRNSGATIGCFVSETGEPQAQLEARKVNINFRRRYGS